MKLHLNPHNCATTDDEETIASIWGVSDRRATALTKQCARLFQEFVVSKEDEKEKNTASFCILDIAHHVLSNVNLKNEMEGFFVHFIVGAIMEEMHAKQELNSQAERLMEVVSNNMAGLGGMLNNVGLETAD